jgi:hypothetical protein
MTRQAQANANAAEADTARLNPQPGATAKGTAAANGALK